MTVAGLALREPSLDDVFLALTGHRAEVEEDGDDGADGNGRHPGREHPGGAAGHDGNGKGSR
jgi:hypothetical protein